MDKQNNPLSKQIILDATASDMFRLRFAPALQNHTDEELVGLAVQNAEQFDMAPAAWLKACCRQSTLMNMDPKTVGERLPRTAEALGMAPAEWLKACIMFPPLFSPSTQTIIQIDDGDAPLWHTKKEIESTIAAAPEAFMVHESSTIWPMNKRGYVKQRET